MELTGWGRYPRFETRVFEPHSQFEAARLQRQLAGFIPRGAGRAYGDAAIGVTSSVSVLPLDRFQHFDASNGRLTVEAGVVLSDIIAAFLSRGFFPPVVPGTQFVTVGGMIASDVHGKNHHGAGSFGDHVEALKLALPDGEVTTCSAQENPDLFAATIGGMGLTGVILAATFKLIRIETAWIRQETVVAHNLAEAIAALTERDEEPYSAAWIDCLARGPSLGRSLVHLGRHALKAEVESSRHRIATQSPAALGTPSQRSDRSAGHHPQSLERQRLQRSLFPQRRHESGGAIPQCDRSLFLSARRRFELEQNLWAARLSAASKRHRR